MLTRIRRRRVLIAAIAGAGFAAVGISVAASRAANAGSAATTGGTAVELPKTSTALAPLRAHVTYAASTFPLGVRLTPPTGSWVGAQYTATAYGRPAFGWAVLGHPGPGLPLGEIDIETAYGSTPPVTAILARLRSAGGGAKFGKTARVTVAGYPGWQIGGEVFGRFGHVFVPFTPRTGGASPPDHLRLEKGEAFQIIVLDVRHKRVVLFLVSAGLPAEQFPAFLTSATQLLKTLTFPA